MIRSLKKSLREFIKRVDFNKKIFTQKDIDQLNKYRNEIDDELNDSSYEFFDAVMKIYSQRNEQAYRYSKLALEKPFDFDSEESIETDGDKLFIRRRHFGAEKRVEKIHEVASAPGTVYFICRPG
jgi:Mg2+ and Co2+ transporter CorA